MNAKHRKKGRICAPLGIITALLGIALILASILLLLRDRNMEKAIETSTQDILLLIEEAQTPTPMPTAAPIVTSTPKPTQTPEPTPTPVPALPVEVIDGHEYVGYLEFPSLDRKLPIIKIKYVEDLKVAPCLEKGSPYTDDAVISGHNYKAHFGPIRKWTGGEDVIFTDLNGDSIHYKVAVVEVISPSDVEKVMNSEHDLVLYTCISDGKERSMIACDRADEQN